MYTTQVFILSIILGILAICFGPQFFMWLGFTASTAKALTVVLAILVSWDAIDMIISTIVTITATCAILLTVFSFITVLKIKEAM